LSGVGVAAGAGTGVGLAVCAIVFEPIIGADAASTSAVNNHMPRPIAVSPLCKEIFFKGS